MLAGQDSAGEGEQRSCPAGGASAGMCAISLTAVPAAGAWPSALAAGTAVSAHPPGARHAAGPE